MKPRVLFLSPQPFFQWRGSPIRVHYNLRALSELGYHVDLVTLPFGEDVHIPHVHIHRVSPFKHVTDIPIGPSFSKLLFDFKIYLAARRLLRQHTYILVHGIEDAGFFACFLARRKRLKRIYEKHSDPASYRKNFLQNLVMAVYAQVERFTIHHVDAVIATGAGLANRVRQLSPNTPCTHICDIPSSLAEADPARVRDLRADLQQHPDEILVTYVGSFAVYQGIDLLFDAIPHTLRLAPHVRFLIIGGSDAEIRERQDRLREQDADASVSFLGKINPDDLPAHLRASDILLSPRVSGNNTPLKLLDYLKAERAILATDTESNRLILDESTALFAPPTPTEFAQGIASLATQPDQREKLAAAGKHLIEQTYNYPHYKQQLQSVYAPLTSSTPPSSSP